MPVISDLSLTITPSIGLYTSPVSDGVIVASEKTDQGRNQIVLDFNGGDGLYSRDLGTIFQWPTLVGTVLRRWQPTLLPQPETIFSRATPWDDGGIPGAKFIQGYMVSADSYNVAKTFQIESQDDHSIHTVYETPATFNQQAEIAFSCDPFIAHAVRLLSSDGVRWRIFNTRPVFQPYPELATVWKTEMVNFGMGWQHVRLLNIPYIATAAVTLTLLLDGNTQVISGQMPATASQLYPIKQKVIPQATPNKAKLVGFQATSSAPFRVFQEMLEVWVGAWGRTDSYTIVRPFGGKAAAGAEV